MVTSSSDSHCLGTSTRRDRCVFDEAGWIPTPSLRRRDDPLANRINVVIWGALAALPAGYVVAAWLTPIGVVVAPSPAIVAKPFATDTRAAADEPESAPTEAAAEGSAARGNEEERRNARSADSITAAPPQRVPAQPSGTEISEPLIARTPDPRCLPSASAVRQNFPDARPSWTMRMPGHEGARCWFAAAPAAPSAPGRPETAQADDTADAIATQVLQERRAPKPLVAASDRDPACLPSASAVRLNFPEARPSWSMRTPGHEGTQCWYAAKPRSPRSSAGVAWTPGWRASQDDAEGSTQLPGEVLTSR